MGFLRGRFSVPYVRGIGLFTVFAFLCVLFTVTAPSNVHAGTEPPTKAQIVKARAIHTTKQIAICATALTLIATVGLGGKSIFHSLRLSGEMPTLKTNTESSRLADNNVVVEDLLDVLRTKLDHNKEKPVSEKTNQSKENLKYKRYKKSDENINKSRDAIVLELYTLVSKDKVTADEGKLIKQYMRYLLSMHNYYNWKPIDRWNAVGHYSPKLYQQLIDLIDKKFPRQNK